MARFVQGQIRTWEREQIIDFFLGGLKFCWLVHLVLVSKLGTCNSVESVCFL